MKNVAIIKTEKSKSFIGVFARCAKAIEKQGYLLSFYVDELPLPHQADMYLIDGYAATDDVLELYKNKPIIILEKADSASVYFREILKDKRVDGMLKTSKLVDVFENNRNYRAEELFCGAERENDDDIIHLTDEELEKVECGPSFFTYDSLTDWQRLNDVFDKTKHIDIHCVCSTEKYSPFIQKMRKRAIKKIRNFGKDKDLNVISGEGRPYKKAAYREQLCDTKIVVAPWGNGYSSYRMAEAMLAGCVLVTPFCDFAEMMGVEMLPYSQYFPCQHDYSDLEDILEFCLINFNTLENVRRTNQLLARNLFNEMYIAEWFSIYARQFFGAKK